MRRGKSPKQPGLDALLTLSSKGQLVIPARLRQLLELNPGDRLELSLEADGLLLKPPRLREGHQRPRSNRLRRLPGAPDPPGAAGSGPLRQRNAALTLPVALDTNLLVRLLTGDEPEQAGRVADLIDASPAARSSLPLKA